MAALSGRFCCQHLSMLRSCCPELRSVMLSPEFVLMRIVCCYLCVSPSCMMEWFDCQVQVILTANCAVLRRCWPEVWPSLLVNNSEIKPCH